MRIKNRMGGIATVITTVAICLCVSFFIPGCSGEEDDFKEVSRLISERNKGRLNAAKGRSGTAASGKTTEENRSEETSQRSYKLLYEEEVEIRSVSSKKVIGKGTAYLDKNGKIVQIRIKRRD